MNETFEKHPACHCERSAAISHYRIATVPEDPLAITGSVSGGDRFEICPPRVASPAISDFAKTMVPKSNRDSPRRLNLNPEKTKNGLAQLVLTVVKLLHELLEKQAIRRIDGGGLTDEEIERLGFTLMRQSEEIAKIAREFGLESDDLNLDLGPLGKLL